MSKASTSEKVDFGLVQIDEAGFSMKLPADLKPVSGFNFHVGLEAAVNPEKKWMIVTNSITIKSENSGPLLAEYTVKYAFEFTSFDQFQFDDANKPLIPRSLQMAINAIAISTTRGLMFAKFKGTPLHNAILPLIPASDF